MVAEREELSNRSGGTMPILPPISPRLVKCPKCRSILQEPPPGHPFYQCGNCSTTLQAKHATPGDLEAASRRIGAEQGRRNSSYSDSSSGEIGSDAVVDEYVLTGSGNHSPIYKNGEELVRYDGMRAGDVRREVKRPQQQQYPALDAGMVLSDSFLQTLRNQELDMKHRILDSSPRAPRRKEIASSREEHPFSSSDQHSSYGMSPVAGVDQRTETRSHQGTAVTSSGEFKAMPSVGTEITLASSESRTISNGNDFITREDHQQQLPVSHVLQRNHPAITLDSVRDDAYNESNAHDAHVSQPPMASRSNIASAVSRGKLRWKGRESDSGEEATSSGADDDGSSQDDLTSSASVKKSTSVDYNVEPNWRSSLGENEQVTRPAGHQQQFVRTPSEDSDRPLDMYDNSAAHVLDYEPSDTSSTTMEEMDISAGGAGSLRFSGEMDSYPRGLIDKGSSQPVSRRHIPPSSHSPHNSPRETASPDNLRENARMLNVAARRHSWDDRVSTTGIVLAPPGHTGPLRGSPSSVRRKSSSQDYGSGQQEDYLQKMSSDTSGRGYGSSKGRPLTTSSSMYDNYSRPTNPFAINPLFGPQQLWVNRYVPASQSTPQQWSPNSTAHPRFYLPEPSSLHPSQSRLPSSVRGGQYQTCPLLPKPGHYPALPPPGTLQHVLCQHCAVLLAVPENLPASQKNTQKLRCGSCRKISIFSVPRTEESNTSEICNSSSRSQSLQSDNAGLLASSPESQAEFTSTYRPVSDSLGSGEKQRSIRRHSVSDLSERKQEVQQAQPQPQAPLIRKHSLGNEDLKDVDLDLLEEKFVNERVQSLSINANLSASLFRDAASTGSETESPSSPYPRSINSISLPVNAAFQLPGPDRKLSSEGILSDSDSDSLQRTLSAAGSPQLNMNSTSPNHLNSISPPALPEHSHQQDPTSSGRVSNPDEQVHEVARGLNKTLNRIFLFRKSKQAGAAQYRRKVVVNGVPIPDHLVKKSEEQAGPIRPGTYWYDSQAGFWGVAGGQCLGIIPPFIEEFNYPMTRDSAAGRTGIFVNGRELHHVDKEKLCCRGLPDTPGMSYLIEIDGRVVEEATGSELRSLGRLAPSVEKNGRGAGMYVPSNISGRS